MYSRSKKITCRLYWKKLKNCCLVFIIHLDGRNLNTGLIRRSMIWMCFDFFSRCLWRNKIRLNLKTFISFPQKWKSMVSTLHSFYCPHSYRGSILRHCETTLLNKYLLIIFQVHTPAGAKGWGSPTVWIQQWLMGNYKKVNNQ